MSDCRLPVSSSRAQPRDLYCTLESACMRRGKTMSWCCRISGDERFAIKISGLRSKWRCARSAIKTPRRFWFLCAAPALLTPNWRVELSHAIKGKLARWANPESIYFSLYNSRKVCQNGIASFWKKPVYVKWSLIIHRDFPYKTNTWLIIEKIYTYRGYR